VVVTGPTASGKTRIAVALARTFNGEIVSADSRQVYRGLDIGTGKDLDEYVAGGAPVPYHLINIVGLDEDYSLYRYKQDATAALRGVAAAGRQPILCGGSPLYVNALLADYRLEGGGENPDLRARLAPLSDSDLDERLRRQAPDLHARTDTTQRRRVIRGLEIAASRTRHTPPGEAMPPLRLDTLILAPYYPRAVMHERIRTRLEARLRQGLIEEVQRLHDSGVPWERLDFLGLEYRWVARHLKGELSRDEMTERLLAAIRRFCKGQDAWFRKMEREGRAIHWLPEGDLRLATERVGRFLRGQPLPPPSLRLCDTLYGPRSQ